MRLLGCLRDWLRERNLPFSGDPIKHVVVLMFENHSFDQMLGCFKSVYQALEGVDSAHPGSNKDSAGRAYPQRQHADTVVKPDPKHDGRTNDPI